MTVFFSWLPAWNFGTVAALIHTFSPVRGLTPWRAARREVVELPETGERHLVARCQRAGNDVEDRVHGIAGVLLA